MAIQVFTNPKITIGGVDLTNHITQVTLEYVQDAIETTAFGPGNARTYVGGLTVNKFSLTLEQDFAAASVESTIYPLLGTSATVQMLPLNASTSSVNPSYTFSVLVNDWKPMDGKVGDLFVTAATWPITGPITKGTT